MLTLQQFIECCHERGLPLTQQREAIYRALLSLEGHPTPEELFDRARELDPSLSLATVYNNIRRFLDLGIIGELSPVHGGMRIEINSAPHFHAICTVCHSVADIEGDPLGSIHTEPLQDFVIQRIRVDVLGVCAACQSHTPRRPNL